MDSGGQKEGNKGERVVAREKMEGEVAQGVKINCSGGLLNRI